MLNFSLKHCASKPALLAALVLLAVSGAPGARAAGSDILSLCSMAPAPCGGRLMTAWPR